MYSFMKMNKIIILGGGSAGWMTAATMIKTFPDKEIILIESPNAPTVGVGESTIGGIRDWTKYLGIDDKEFLKHTDGSYKLSIKFTDFYRKGTEFHYPFGQPVIDGNHAKLNDWWFKKFLKPKTPNSDYAECHFPQMALVNNNKLDYNKDNIIPFDFHKNTAYHFDATKFGVWLKEHYCLPRGVKHIEEDIKDIKSDENGIVSLNGHSADLFIDCTGFKSLLLDKTINEPFESYNDLLPNNSAWATKIEYNDKEKEIKPYTNCTAINNGWVWNIPLWSRIGTGYVYSDKFVSDEEALKEFKEYLGRDDLEFKNIKMRVGIHKRLFVKNVVAIGLAAGFIEPLESNGLFTVHEFLIRLVRTLNREKISQWDKDNYTYQCKRVFRDFAEFVAMHYAFSQRTDTKYWQSNFNKEWTSDIINLKRPLLNGMVEAAIHRDDSYHFPHDGGLHTIAAGMNWPPTDLETIMYTNQLNRSELETNYKQFIDRLDMRKNDWNNIVKHLPSLYDFMKENIYD